jgi:hypothetical protein
MRALGQLRTSMRPGEPASTRPITALGTPRSPSLASSAYGDDVASSSSPEVCASCSSAPAPLRGDDRLAAGVGGMDVMHGAALGDAEDAH